MKVSPALVGEVPAEVVTVTSTDPDDPAGETAVKVVGDVAVNDVAASEPNLTAVAPVKFVPVTVTEVPPAVEPVLGLTEETVGGGVTPVPAAISTATPPDTPLGLCVAVGCTAAETLTS